MVTKLLVVTIGCILGKEVIRETRDKQGNSRNNHCQPPSEEFVHTEAENSRKDERHYHLRNTAAEVPPTCRGRVRCTDTIGGEHRRCMILRDDERGTDGTDCQSE